jgi:hypothetical protein
MGLAERDRAAMQRGHRPDQGQAEPRTRRGPRGIGTEEPLPGPLAVGIWQTIAKKYNPPVSIAFPNAGPTTPSATLNPQSNTP